MFFRDFGTPEESGFVAKCVQLPVATEGETREKAVANLKETKTQQTKSADKRAPAH
jgi:predicted RNase H-like HicB family nuclease